MVLRCAELAVGVTGVLACCTRQFTGIVNHVVVVTSRWDQTFGVTVLGIAMGVPVM